VRREVGLLVVRIRERLLVQPGLQDRLDAAVAGRLEVKRAATGGLEPVRAVSLSQPEL
jgi:hypothetical protein